MESLTKILLEGDTNSLHKLLEQYPNLLERYAILGVAQISNTSFVLQSPLHVSAKLGHLEMVKFLISKYPDMCHAHDQDGRNPVHVATIRGHKEVLCVFLQDVPDSAREQTNNANETILHLCVKYRQLELMQWLMNEMDVGDLKKTKDCHGNTLLHLAVATNQLEAVKFLLEKFYKMERNELNSNGMTAMDICLEKNDGKKCGEIWQCLKSAKALSAKDALKKKPQGEWIEKQSNSLIVVAALIAGMAFQVGVNPPGGTWQDDKKGQHFAGTSIMADNVKPSFYDFVMLCANATGLISSLSVILMLISGLSFGPVFVAILRIIMWLAISSTTLIYVSSVAFISIRSYSGHHPELLTYFLLVWAVVMWLVIILHVIRLFSKVIKKLRRLLIRWGKVVVDKKRNPQATTTVVV